MTGSRRWLACGLVLLAGAAPALAQTFHGGLRGAVRETGGVVPGASVTLVNEATNASRTAQTNHVGEYAFVNVDPGDYTLKVSMQGFKSIENKGIHIGTQQFLTLDFSLEVGNLQESITVEGATPLETSNASEGSTLDSKTLETLPTAGRNPFFLAVTTPGVVATGDPQFVRQQDQTNSSLLNLAGGPRRGNNYTIDDAVVRAPTPREISGDFSQSGVTIYDPLTTVQNPDGSYSRKPFPNNIIPASRISPVARGIQPYWPNAGPASASLIDKSYTGTFKLDEQWNKN